MEYDRGDSFPFDFEPNGFSFGSISKGKLSGKTEKTSPIRIIAVRETGVSRHQRGTIKGLPETPRTSQHYHIEGLIM